MRLLLALALVACVSAENSYIAVFRQTFRADMTYSVQVRILNATGPVNVTVDLRTNNGNVSIIKSPTKQLNVSQQETFDLQIPSLRALKPYLDKTAYIQYWYRQSFRLVINFNGSLNFQNFSNIRFNKKSFSIYVQTDKAMYKPGQNVQFRVFGAYPDLKLVKKPMNVMIFDPQNNKIKQWLRQVSPCGVVTKNIEISPEPLMGDWTIKIIMGTLVYKKTFTVAKYVLPKFEVMVELPSYGLVGDRDIVGKVRAKYTFGKPVEGTVTLRVEKSGFRDSANITKEIKLSNGIAPFTIPTFELMYLRSKWQLRQTHKSFIAYNPFNISASVRETLTGNVLSGESTYRFHEHDYKIQFLSTNPTYFKPGLSSVIYFKVTHQDGRPIVNMREKVTVKPSATVKVSADDVKVRHHYYHGRTETIQLTNATLDVPISGYLSYTIETVPENTTHVNVQVLCKGAHSQTHGMEAMSSPSQNYVAVTLLKSDLKGGETAKFRIDATETVDIYSYQVFSRGKAISTGHWQAVDNSAFNYELPVTSQMAPSSRVIVYYVRRDGEIAADSISFNVAGVFSNKVTLSFDAIKVKPQTEVTLTVSADPNSKVNVLAVDKSVQLLKSGNDISTDLVKNELQSYDEVRRWHYGRRYRHRRSIICQYCWWPRYYGGSSASEVFENAGYEVLTDALLPQPTPHRGPEVVYDGAPGSRVGIRHKSVHMARNNLAKPTSTRKLFPETWLWTSENVQADGTVKITTKIPDTITTWVASAFATNPTSGLGVAESPASVTVFLPFFVTIDLPYSVVRGEEVIIQAVVFNYLDSEVQAVVTLEASDEVQNINIDPNGGITTSTGDKTNTVKIPSGEGKTVYFPVVATKVGTSLITVKVQSPRAADRVQRQLLVEPEGLRQEYTITELVDHRDDSVTESTVEMEIAYPSKTVNGSQRVKFSVMGDVLGSALDNLDQLLRMPTGCGEQNMAKFAPDVHILGYLKATQQSTKAITDKAVRYLESVIHCHPALGLNMAKFAPDVHILGYLKATQQSTKAITEKAVRYLESGYQRQLTYRHRDGAYSIWGPGHKTSGSLWLTSFVAKSFLQARPYIFIDKRIIVSAIKWILRYQDPDGTFTEPSKRHGLHVPFSAIDQKAARTAYTFITLLHARDANYKELKDILPAKLLKTQRKLESVYTAAVKSPYALSIIAYALKLANSPVAPRVLARLDALAVIDKGPSYLRMFVMDGRLDVVVMSPYALSIIAYALKLANSPVAPRVLARLDAMAVMDKGLKRWKNAGYTVEYRQWYRRSPARDVETAAYAALATLHGSTDINQVLPIVKWLATQRNAYGGFFSTQDTVVALHAFTQFGQITYAKNTDLTVTFYNTPNQLEPMPGSINHQYMIQGDNRMLKQMFEITDSTQDLMYVTSKGTGTAIAQAAVRYNVEQDFEKQSFHLGVQMKEETAVVRYNVEQDFEKQSFHLGVQMKEETVNAITLRVCARRLAQPTGAEGMVMVEIGTPSGFAPDEESLTARRRVKRHEIDNDKLVLYLDFLDTGLFCVTVDVVRTGLVAKSQPAAVVVYDYYEPGNQVKAFYQSQLLKNTTSCDMCGVDCGCM